MVNSVLVFAVISAGQFWRMGSSLEIARGCFHKNKIKIERGGV